MILLLLAVLYLSFVVIIISSLALMGKSSSFTVFPVRISGPFCGTAFVSTLAHTMHSGLTCRVQSNCQWSTRHQALSFSGVVNHRLVVLCSSVSLDSEAWSKVIDLVGAMRKVHSDDIQTTLAKSAISENKEWKVWAYISGAC